MCNVSDLTALDQAENDGNECDHQQDMNKRTGSVADVTNGPKDDKNNGD